MGGLRDEALLVFANKQDLPNACSCTRSQIDSASIGSRTGTGTCRARVPTRAMGCTRDSTGSRRRWPNARTEAFHVSERVDDGRSSQTRNLIFCLCSRSYLFCTCVLWQHLT